MTETPRKKRRWVFPVVLLVYAVIFLGATAFGLKWFWNFIDAYEQSRPETAMNAYMERVDADYLCAGGADPVIAAVDLNIQSREACLDYIKGTLTGDIRYACKMSECTEDKMVYMVLCGKLGVCKVTLTGQPADEYGFTRWEVASEEFDLSHVKTATAEITVPHNFPVTIGDARMDERYILEDRILYPELAEYYKSNQPPYLVTYRSGAFLGDLSFTVTDPAGEPVTIGADTDLKTFMNNCTRSQNEELDALVDGYIHRYVDYLSCTGNDSYRNYWRLKEYLVPDSELENRFYAALDGMYWVSDRRSTVTDLSVDYRVALGDGRYLCIVSYEVDTHLHNGLAHEVSNVHLIAAETENGIKVERMEIK